MHVISEFCLDYQGSSSLTVQQPGQRQRPQKRVAGPPKARPRGGTLPGMRSMPTRNRSMLGLAAKPSMERCSSAKRRRNDYDVSDMIMPHMSGAGGPKFVERVQVSQPICLRLAMPACMKAFSVHGASVSNANHLSLSMSPLAAHPYMLPGMNLSPRMPSQGPLSKEQRVDSSLGVPVQRWPKSTRRKCACCQRARLCSGRRRWRRSAAT